MCVHLNVSQFYSYKRMTLGDQCVNVMEIAFGLVNANGIQERGNLHFTGNSRLGISFARAREALHVI